MKNTYLACDACGGKIKTCEQIRGDVFATSPTEIIEFVSRHAAQCRGNRPTSASDKGFHTTSENIDRPPVIPV